MDWAYRAGISNYSVDGLGLACGISNYCVDGLDVPCGNIRHKRKMMLCEKDNSVV